MSSTARRPASPQSAATFTPETRDPRPETQHGRPKTRDPRPQTQPPPETQTPRPSHRDPRAPHNNTCACQVRAVRSVSHAQIPVFTPNNTNNTCACRVCGRWGSEVRSCCTDSSHLHDNIRAHARCAGVGDLKSGHALNPRLHNP
jgi:hypothetical protein